MQTSIKTIGHLFGIGLITLTFGSCGRPSGQDSFAKAESSPTADVEQVAGVADDIVGAKWPNHPMKLELHDVSRRLNNDLSTCWLHSGLKEIEIAHYAFTGKKVSFSIDYSILQTTHHRFLKQVKGSSFVKNDLESGGEVNEARFIAQRYGLVPESEWKNKSIIWRQFADSANESAKKILEMKQVNSWTNESKEFLAAAELEFKALVSRNEITLPEAVLYNGKNYKPTEIANSFLTIDPSDFTLFGVKESSGDIKTKADMQTKQDIFMTNWKSVQIAIKSILVKRNSVLWSAWIDFDQMSFDNGFMKVTGPISETPDGHVMNIVGYSLDANGDMNWLKIENTWGSSEGTNGYYLVSWTDFKKMYQAISIPDAKSIIRKENLKGGFITK